jgi:hypothetical protein
MIEWATVKPNNGWNSMSEENFKVHTQWLRPYSDEP